MNHFDLFGLETKYLIDKEELRKRYYEKARSYHPDKYSLNSDKEQFESLEKTTHINAAFRILNNDDQRLRYLLEIAGIEFAEGQETVPQDFLMEVMDINELLMEYKMDQESRIKEDITGRLSELKSNLKNTIEKVLLELDFQKADKKQLELIKDYYLKSKYLKRIESNLEN